MGPRDIVPTPDSCPWGGWAPPDIQHCEENLCAWVAAPADSWSNLAYLAMGVYLIRRAPPGPARIFGPLALFVGMSSFLFHASFTAAFQALDYAAMFALFLSMLALNAWRAGLLGERALARSVWSGTGLCLLLFALLRKAGLPVQPMILALAAAVLFSEYWLWRRERAPSYAWLGGAVALAACGFALWLGDYTRLLCNPGDHLWQGHAAWHLLTALGIGALARYYAQFMTPTDSVGSN